MNLNSVKILFAFFVLLVVSFMALAFGSVEIGFWELVRILLGEKSGTFETVVWEIRLPRVLLAIAVGGGLSVAGAVLQAILKNPLAEPYVLGISSGGTFGALLAMLLGLSFTYTQFFAFIGALLVIGFVLSFSSKFNGGFKPVTVLLSGVMLGAFFGAAILILLTLMKENLQTAVFWLIGTLSFAEPTSGFYAIAFSVLISLIIFAKAYRINLIAADDGSSAVGINLVRERFVLLALTGVLTGGLVAISGVIGFIGMLVPHLVRNKFGFDNRVVLPLSFLIGAVLLLVSDTFARTVILPAELPVGSVTALFGAPVFIWLLRKKDYYFSS